MNDFDTLIITFLNQFAQQWYLFDKITKAIAVNNMFKGAVFATVIWWAWFRSEGSASNKREHIITTLIGSVVAIGLARFLAYILPFRFRPIHEEALNFVLPYGVSATTLDGWSSFPSDHAVLFFTIATGLLFVSRRVGIFSLIYTTLFISFPRIYIGYHWPTDIIAGMLIGVTIALLCNMYLIKSRQINTIFSWSHSQPMLFYPLLFLLTYQLADLFEASRAVASAVFKMLQSIF